MKAKSVVILLFFLLVSCGGGSSSDNELSEVFPTTQQNSVLLGTWDSICSLELRVLESSNSVARFEADGMYHFTVNHFLNRNCTDLAFVDEHVGSFVDGESSLLPDGRLIADLDLFLLDQRNFTPQTQEVADEFNSQFFCGFDDWQAGVTKNIFGCQDGLLVALTFDQFEIYHLDEDYYLYLGSGPGLHPEGRPDELALAPAFVRRSEIHNFPADIIGLWSALETGDFYEFRTNNLIYNYSQVSLFGLAGCHNAAPTVVRSLESGEYADFQGVTLSLEYDGTFLSLVIPELDRSITLTSRPDISSADFEICETQLLMPTL